MIFLNDAKFRIEYKNAVDCVLLPENYKSQLISELSSANYNRNRTQVFVRVAASLAAVLLLAVCVGLFARLSGFAPKTFEEVSVKVMSATNLGAVKGARVAFISAVKSHEPVVAVADEKGVATASLPKGGEYTAVITAEGYISCEAEFVKGGNVYISPEMTEDTYRAVLLWEGEHDLDAFLTMTVGESTEQIHYFKSDITNEAGEVVAVLDTDSTTGGFPETVTFNPQKDTAFKFSAGSYSALKDKSGNLTDAEPQVFLYKGVELIEIFSINTDEKGNVWDVFEIKDGVVSELSDVYTAESFGQVN